MCRSRSLDSNFEEHFHRGARHEVLNEMPRAVFVGYAVLAALVRNHIVSRPGVMRRIRRSFAGAFVLLGAKLALADR